MDEINPSDQGTWNDAQEYLKTIQMIRRELTNAFINNDIDDIYKLLSNYWCELSEWVTDKERSKYDSYRLECMIAYDKINHLKSLGVTSIPRPLFEKFWEWRNALNKLKNNKGLTMRKGDDPGLALGGGHY